MAIELNTHVLSVFDKGKEVDIPAIKGEDGLDPFIYSDTEPQGEDRKPIWLKKGAVQVLGSDWNQDNPTSGEYVKNRPFYTTPPKYTEILPEAEYTFERDTWRDTENGKDGHTFKDFRLGNTITVEYDSTVYNLPVKEFKGLYFVIGNMFLMASDEPDSGEPFVMSYNERFPSSSMIRINKESYSTPENHKIKVYGTFPNIKIIDPVYIPQNGIGFRTKEGGEIFNGAEVAGNLAHAEGSGRAFGKYSHAEGNGESIGDWSHSEGGWYTATVAYGRSSHAEGYNTTAEGTTSHAEGGFTLAAGLESHSENVNGLALGKGTHVEGMSVNAIGDYSHVEGKGFSGRQDNLKRFEYELITPNTIVLKDCTIENIRYIYIMTQTGKPLPPYKVLSRNGESFTVSPNIKSNVSSTGDVRFVYSTDNMSLGIGSHAEGGSTIATSDYSHVQGKYNVEDTANKYADIVGNGKGDTERSNAETTSWSGVKWVADDVRVGGTDMDDPNAVSLKKTYTESSPVISETLNGAVIATDIVSSKPHKVGVEVSTSNLIIPLSPQTVNVRGVDFTINSDGTMSAKGTSKTAGGRTIGVTNNFKMSKGTYILSVSEDLNHLGFFINNVKTSAYIGSVVKKDTPKVITVTDDIVVFGGFNVENAIVYNQPNIKIKLEKGTVATPYTPYIPDVSVGKVDVYGKNLFNPENIHTPALVVESSGELASENGSYSFWMPVKAGEVYTFNLPLDTKMRRYAFFESEPFIGATAVDGKAYTFAWTVPKTITITDERAHWLLISFFRSTSPISIGDAVKSIQLEYGDKSTSYTPYIPPTSYPVPPDGILSIDSISPAMTITTDTPGLALSATYNCDTKGYVDREIKKYITKTLSSVTTTKEVINNG